MIKTAHFFMLASLGFCFKQNDNWFVVLSQVSLANGAYLTVAAGSVMRASSNYGYLVRYAESP